MNYFGFATKNYRYYNRNLKEYVLFVFFCLELPIKSVISHRYGIAKFISDGTKYYKQQFIIYSGTF